jgi:hypothetical protein
MHRATNRPIHIAQDTEFHLHGMLRESFTQTKSSYITTDGQSAVCLGIRQTSRTRNQFFLLLPLIIFIQLQIH